MDATARLIIRYLGVVLAFVGLLALADAALLLVIPEQLPTGQLTDRSPLALLAREVMVGLGALGLGAVVLNRTRVRDEAAVPTPPNAPVY